VLELESTGYIARRETYTVKPEQHPETGYIVNLYCMEVYLVSSDKPNPRST